MSEGNTKSRGKRGLFSRLGEHGEDAATIARFGLPLDTLARLADGFGRESRPTIIGFTP